MKSIDPVLAVNDIQTSLDFYNKVLGFETAMTLPNDDGDIVHASVRRGNIGLMFSPVAADPTISGPLGTGVTLYLTVGDDEDIDGLFATARGAGATVVQAPTDQFWGHRDWAIRDPDGYHLIVSKQVANPTVEEMQAQLSGAAV